MPLGVSIPIGVVTFLALRFALGDTLVNPAFVGFGMGYLAYDGIHYAVHHFRMSSRIGKWLKRPPHGASPHRRERALGRLFAALGLALRHHGRAGDSVVHAQAHRSLTPSREGKPDERSA